VTGWRAGGLAGWLAVALLPACPLARLPAQTVDTIVVQNHNVFDATGDGPGFVARLANALHVTTRAAVIRRTLLLDAGDHYDSARVTESERALRALGIFRQVKLDTTRLDGRLAVRVFTADGWSTKPQTNFSSAGGSVRWELGMVEQNFLGTATTLAAVYKHNPDRTGVDLQYQSPHFLTRRTTLAGEYTGYSDGKAGTWQVGLPFYETAARWSLVTDGAAAHQRVLSFRDGANKDTTQRRALRFGVTAGYALRASSAGYVRLWGGASWGREDFADSVTAPFAWSTFGAAGAGVELGHARFAVLEHFNSYARREDQDLSQVLRLGVWATPRAWGYAGAHAGLGPELKAQGSAAWRGGFAVLRASGHGIYSGPGLDSGRVQLALTVASQNLPRQAWIVHVEGGVAQHPDSGSEFDLWNDQTGPRLFGAHEFTGTRMSWFAVEDRILVAEEAWGLVGVGLAPFLDWGGAWYADERARQGGDVGVALRLGPTRSVRGDVAEIAIGARFGLRNFVGSRWAIAIRRGVQF
jgi:hypothetical protein